MHPFLIPSVFLSFTVVLLALNHYLKKPMQANIFIVIGSLLFCVVYRYLYHINLSSEAGLNFVGIINQINFPDILINGILSYLLFAGALHCDYNIIKKLKYTIMPLALIGTILSTILIGISMYYLLTYCGIKTEFLTCLIFGALISPTDPIAVLSMLKELGAAKFLKETIAGESLFNDGVGIVMFTTLLGFSSGTDVTFQQIFYLFVRLSIGGLLYGYILGKVGIWLINTVKQDLQFSFILTLWITTTGYAIANLMDVSGPLAMVMSGLVIGNQINNNKTREYLFSFWDIIDNALNCFLFLLIGLELLIITIPYNLFLLMFITILITLISRSISVILSLKCFKKQNKKTLPLWPIISWGGLRGGLAIALVLSVPNEIDHTIFIFLTYAVVLFSIIIQGLTIKPLLNKIALTNDVDSVTSKN